MKLYLQASGDAKPRPRRRAAASKDERARHGSKKSSFSIFDPKFKPPPGGVAVSWGLPENPPQAADESGESF